MTIAEGPEVVSPGELFSFAKWYGERLGYRFGDGARHHVEDLCRETAAAIQARVAEEGNAERALLYRRQAEASLAYFVERMVQASYELPGYREDHPNIIGETTFWAVRSVLCPCWPIC